MGLVAACAVACAAVAPPNAAFATPPPSATSAAPLATPSDIPQDFDRVDVITLMATVIEELKNYEGSILLETKPAETMPSYDPLVFYAGLGADRSQPYKPVIWTVADTSAKGYQHALIRAFVMAVIATGEAGPKFKRAYDVATGEDRSLPSSAPDPYANRHALTEPFVEELTQTRP
jgi:hypothetical protein